MKDLKHIKRFNESKENLNISDFDESKITENVDDNQKNKMSKLKELLEMISDVDIMYHEERREYFFEWWKDGKFITVWLGDYV